MNFKHFLILVPGTILLAAGPGAATAGQPDVETGAFACINDKWDEKEIEKGHKLVDYAGRCVTIPDDATKEKYTEDCVGKYEYMPDQSWKGFGTCTWKFQGGDTIVKTFDEGSHAREYDYKILSGTGKYKGASGSGAYTYDNLPDTLSGGRFKGRLILP